MGVSLSSINLTLRPSASSIATDSIPSFSLPVEPLLLYNPSPCVRSSASTSARPAARLPTRAGSFTVSSTAFRYGRSETDSTTTPANHNYSPMDISPRSARLRTLTRASAPSSPRLVRASTFPAPSTAISSPMSSTRSAPVPTATFSTPR